MSCIKIHTELYIPSRSAHKITCQKWGGGGGVGEEGGRRNNNPEPKSHKTDKQPSQIQKCLT